MESTNHTIISAFIYTLFSSAASAKEVSKRSILVWGRFHRLKALTGTSFDFERIVWFPGGLLRVIR
jgi:hypothetical protein